MIQNVLLFQVFYHGIQYVMYKPDNSEILPTKDSAFYNLLHFCVCCHVLPRTAGTVAVTGFERADITAGNTT